MNLVDITMHNGSINKKVPKHKLSRFKSEGWKVKETKKSSNKTNKKSKTKTKKKSK